MANGNSSRTGAAGDILSLHDKLSQNLMVVDQLCRRLEVVADGLPVSVDMGDCNELADHLCAQLKLVHQFEETMLFPLLVSRAKQADEIVRIVERLRFEHWEDEAYANEVQEALGKFVKAPRSANIEGLSWMLRGFFESVRRHVAFERDHVLPMLAS
jgi:hemerythrin-like domain-containing protein